MMALRFFLRVARDEARDGIRSLVPSIAFFGMFFYMLFNLGDAELFTQMGGAGIPRNSAFIIYTWTAGQALWLMFVWAWIFGQTVLRDKTTGMQPIVLACPVSLTTLLLARFVGATVVGTVVASAIPLAFLVAPALAALGMFPAEAFGPTQWPALALSVFLFGFLSTLSIGGICAAAVLLTRTIAGPFAVAAALIMLWVSAIISLSEGSAAPLSAVLLDPSGFIGVEAQTDLWTPVEKTGSLLALADGLAANRLLWVLGGLLLFAVMLLRTTRERLASEAEGKSLRVRPEPEGAPPLTSLPLTRSFDWRAVWLEEARWHLTATLRSPGFWVLAGFVLLTSSAYPIVAGTSHEDGPLIPYMGQIVWIVVEGSYLTLLAAAAIFAGVMVRRDDRPGHSEMMDATPAPIPARFFSIGAALLPLLLILALVPALSIIIIQSLNSQVAATPGDAILFSVLVIFPPMLDFAVAGLALHTLIRRPGVAYAISLFAVFFITANHEAKLVDHPLISFGLPAHVIFSDLTGWGPWLNSILGMAAYKLSFAAMLLGLVWVLWRAGTDQGWRARLAALQRGVPLRGVALAGTGFVLAAISGGILVHKLATLGMHETRAQMLAANAGYEHDWWEDAGAFTVDAGDISITLDHRARRGHATMMLRGVQSETGQIGMGLPHGTHLMAAMVDGERLDIRARHSHARVALPDCPAGGCELRLDLMLDRADWPDEGAQLWMDRSGLWLRASDILPSFGLDPARVVLSPVDRADFDLPETPRLHGAATLQTASGVLPKGDWSWWVTVADEGINSIQHSRTTGTLDFAVAWQPGRGLTDDIHARKRAAVLRDISTDLSQMGRCLRRVLPDLPRDITLLQAPRGLGELELHGTTLWMPENLGWDTSAGGRGHDVRRFRIGKALARAAIIQRADLRQEPGVHLLTDGFAGWLAAECLREVAGPEAWAALFERTSKDITEVFGAARYPIAQLTEAAAVEWGPSYTRAAVQNWAAGQNATETQDRLLTMLDWMRTGMPLRTALTSAFGVDASQALLGAPRMIEVAVTPDTGALSAEGWTWANGGWQPTVFTAGLKARQDSSQNWMDVTEDAPKTLQSGVVTQALPSYERTPADNRW